MHLAIQADSESAAAAAVDLEKLRAENKGLRELLGIAGISTDALSTL